MRVQKTSKLFIVVLILFITLFLSSCNILDDTEYFYSEEEKQKLVEYFKEYNERENCNYIEIQLDYPVKEGKEIKKYYVIYYYKEKDDGTIVIKKINSYNTNYYIEYIYYNEVMTVNERTRLEDGNYIVDTQEIIITKEGFLNTYKLNEFFKYNIDFEQAKYYRTISRSMHHRYYAYHFDFNENYVLNFNIFNFNLLLTNVRCYIKCMDKEPTLSYYDQLYLHYKIDEIECYGYWIINKERE